MYLHGDEDVSEARHQGGDDVIVTSVIGGHQRPALPPGRMVNLPGRGQTFVRELTGPIGAPVLALLHGWSATADLNWYPSFAPLAENFRVIALDHRGHGRGLRSAERFRLEDCADDVAALAEQLEIDRLIAVGYSMGGPIAQLLWRRHPQLVEGLVLCATSCTFAGTLRERMLLGVAAGTSVIASALPVSPVANSALAALSRWNVRRGGPRWGIEEVARHDWAQIVEAGRQIGRFDSRHWIGSVSVPTTVVVTDADDVVPARRQLDLARAIPHATIRNVPDGHHDCVMVHQRFVPTLVEACAEIAGRVANATTSRTLVAA